MPDDVEGENSLAGAGRTRSSQRGDVPTVLRRRYYTEDRLGAGLGFYVDATVALPAFRDHGDRLLAHRADPNAIRDMTLIAQYRGWDIVTARGSRAFRREAWMTGRSLGLEVLGYRPSERDQQELERRLSRRQSASAGDRQPRPPQRRGTGAEASLTLIERVVRERLVDPAAQARVLAATRERIAQWLERGARFDRQVDARRSREPAREAPRERAR